VRRALAALVILVLLAGCGGEPAPPEGIVVEDLTVDSRAVGRELPVKVVVPGDGPRPLLVFLHGRNNDESTYVRAPMLEALQALGDRAPVVAFPDGGEDSYWHDRADGDWGRYVMDELIPQLTDRYPTERIAIGGISMGGFGAYDLARLNPDRFCAVGGHSPALWRTGGETAPGAFDDAEDFARHDVVSDPAGLEDLPVWLDAGDEDPFRPGHEAFVAALGDVTAHTWPGGHDGDYWDRHWRDYLRFYARELERC
jgi:S-formylglutathione hydrolase FrmB